MEKTKNRRKILVVLLLLSLALVSSMGCTAESIEETEGQEKFEYMFYSEAEGGTGQSKFINEAWGQTDNWGWFTISIFAVFISALIFGLVYAIGYALNMNTVKRYSLSELIQTAATAIMMIALVGLLVGAFDLFSDTFGGTVTCMGEEITEPIDADICRTAEMLNAVNAQYKYAYKAAKKTEMAYSVSVTLLGFPVYQGSFVSSIHKRAETNQYIAHVCTELMFFLTAKIYILKYMQENMLQLFLPLGIILRTFHFTRGIGAFFISIGIAFYFIYPTIVFIMDSSYVANAAVPQMPDIVVSGMCNLPMFGSFSFGSAALEQTDITSAVTEMTLSKNLSSFLADMYTHLMYSNMVGFAMALTFVRFATTILGGDITPFMGMVGRLV
jgi:hypothetical protein